MKIAQRVRVLYHGKTQHGIIADLHWDEVYIRLDTGEHVWIKRKFVSKA